MMVMFTQLPVLCPFQRVTYKIIIAYQGQHILEAGRVFSYRSDYNSECIAEVITTEELQEGKEYTVFVTMETGQILNSNSVAFSKLFFTTQYLYVVSKHECMT